MPFSRLPPRKPVPPRWAHAYFGLPYIMGVGECGHRAALVCREVFGFEAEAIPALGRMSAAHSIIRAELGKPVWMHVLAPVEGDAVVMWKGARLLS